MILIERRKGRNINHMSLIVVHFRKLACFYDWEKIWG